MPDTGSYLILGLVVVGLTFVGYVGSLWWRFRSLRQDAATLRELTEA